MYGLPYLAKTVWQNKPVMKRYLLIRFMIVFGTILFLKTFIDTMPRYGIESLWKKLVLDILLSDRVPKISVAGAYAKKDRVLFLDTRSQEEFEVSHIPNARYAGYKKFNLSKVADLPKNQHLVLYCSIGKRSDVISKQLIHAGFTNVHNIYGGIFEWINKGYEVVNMKNEATDKVYGYNRFWGFWLQKGEKVY